MIDENVVENKKLRIIYPTSTSSSELFRADDDVDVEHIILDSFYTKFLAIIFLQSRFKRPIRIFLIN